MHPTTRRRSGGAGPRGRLRLHPLAPGEVSLRAALVRLEPAPHQLPHSASARQTLPAADADPRRAPFAVLLDETPIGFGVLDRGDLLARVVDEPERAVLLRGFYLAASAQGRGHGRAAAAEVPRLAAHLWGPVARGGPALVVLTVATSNAVALRAYRAAGYVATGVQQQVEDQEPQHVLVAAVPQPSGPAASPGPRERPRVRRQDRPSARST